MERAELIRWLEQHAPVRRAGSFLFLADPQWSRAQRDEVDRLVAPAMHLDATLGWLGIPTGGTSGRVRFARHDEHTLAAAVSGFSLHFAAPQVNAVGVLPQHHVSGLMARVRCAMTGGEYVHVDWKSLEAGKWPALSANKPWFLSLVPTQLQRVMERDGGCDFLRRFRVVLLGGGPLWPQLADAAAEAKLPVALSYGMTETAAMVAAQQPEDFACGLRDAGRVMPHANVVVLHDDAATPSRAGEEGRLQISGGSVMRGYFPDPCGPQVFLTEDLGRVSLDRRVTILSRRDAIIITGGKKVSPIEVENALRETGWFVDVAVIGVPDAEWGEAVVACYPRGQRSIDESALRASLDSRLAPYQRPKRYVEIPDWPRNAQGKINRSALQEFCSRLR